MDKGAHFYRCDFQVHSPRDRQWSGARAVTEDERKGYAIEFVAACRAKGLGAVAITDHHDLAFVKYIRNAAREELTPDGDPLPAELRLNVFPGIELTLGIPCQAILLFDADFPEDLFPLVITALAIKQEPDAEGRGMDPVRMDRITSFEALYEELDRHEYFKGRYIVLPNVSEGGPSTLLRSGHSGHYKNMPCVGGYVDGSINKLGDGNRRILDGKNLEYGHKAIGVFQTSDNRQRDLAKLGAFSTHVKWATPSAEALRQACLARESRISQISPYTPPVVITSIEVSASKFLGPFVLDLNPQYNAIIGGRGTGKSTILEYLRWALCDDLTLITDDGEVTDYQSKRTRLIDRTLAAFDANVQVNFLVNGVSHSVRRYSKSRDIVLKIGTGEFEPATETDIRTILPIQAYSQKQLSSVGVRLDELKRFVRTPIRQGLEDLDRRFAVLAADIRAEYAKLQQKRRGEHDGRNLDRELRSLSEQVAAQRAGLTGIEPGDQEIIAKQAKYDEADQVVATWEKSLSTVRTKVVELKTIVDRTQSLDTEPEALPEADVIKALGVDVRELLSSTTNSLAALERELESAVNVGGVGRGLSEWKRRREVFRLQYEEAKNRSSAHQNLLTQLGELESRARELRGRKSLIDSDISAMGDPESAVRDLQSQWRALHQARAALIREQCEKLTTLSDGYIRVRLEECGVVKGIEDKLRSIFSGARISTSKVEELCRKVQDNSDSLDLWFKALAEFEALSLLDPDEAAIQSLPTTPTLKRVFTDAEVQKIAVKMNPDSWLDLSLTILEDQPVFEYRSREAEYIPFGEASAGQQATALLWALLNQEGSPLIIDQPEDDLDNQVILRVVEQIWKAKNKRQLIFTSHNANLVVNGDAELVACCDYRVAGEQSSGIIKLEGAIDMPNIRDEIAKVMEGGKQAFKLRMEKYGF